MATAVSMISDLVRSVAAGQSLINGFNPQPPPVQFYNIRLGLGAGQNISGSLPSVIMTDAANTQFFATFEGINSEIVKPHRGYQDITINFLGSRGSQKRTNGDKAEEVAVQTSPPSNGFRLKSVDLRGGSEALCISNIVIKSNNAQDPREEIFIPIGDLGYLCGRKWNWGAVLDDNRQRCIWLQGKLETQEPTEFLHLDIEKMSNLFKVDRKDELKRADLSMACTYFGNNREDEVFRSSCFTDPSNSGKSKMGTDGLEDQGIKLEKSTTAVPFGKEASQKPPSDQTVQNELFVGEMRMEDLFTMKSVAIVSQDAAKKGSEQKPDSESISKEDMLELKRSIAEEILKQDEIEAEENLFIQQEQEQEELMKNEIIAENLIEERAKDLSKEQVLELKQNLAVNELMAEEELAEKALLEEELLAEEELIAEQILQEQALAEEQRLREEKLLTDEILAEARLVEAFGEDVSSEERIKTEIELLGSELAAEEDLLNREKIEEEILQQDNIIAAEELIQDEIDAENDLEEEQIIAEQELLDQIRQEDISMNPENFDSSHQKFQEWLQDSEIPKQGFDEEKQPYFEVLSAEEFEDLPSYAEVIGDDGGLRDESYFEDFFPEMAQDWLDEQENFREKSKSTPLPPSENEKGDELPTRKQNSEAPKILERVLSRTELRKRQTFEV